MPESTAARRGDRAHQIITGKHTEHQIPCSPFTTVEAASSSYNGGCMLSYYTTGQSSTMLAEEEEEDMANCLIMLAQSVSPPKENKLDLHSQKTEKIKNRRLTEIASSTAGDGGKSGFHNYECKTCNRAFPSFQALGGHRASHKKPKLTIEDRNSVSIKMEFSGEHQPELLVEYEENKINTNNINSPSPPPGFIQSGYKNSKGKVHECSICGSEFLSGQALGGHMRRHRTAPPPSNQIVVSMNIDDRIGHHITEKSPVLSLDLNLPAPEVIDDVHSNFQLTASSSQQPLVFPATALVDCHY
ncbi:Zinc finger, C2H2 [Cynara cardunculus var. scolymus]|uniref:Zinc finger, C2H2 n=2 Tax=Cynara cardunculus var. scolymus TaxID=59895 RepID=A0A103YHQ4_CYNCS|nr:Zinc finger, C2H2 [Cynara cardunculus var. scolymus]